MDQARKHELLVSLVDELADERGEGAPRAEAGATDEELFSLFRAYVNTRQPLPASAGFLAQQDELLKGLIAEAGVHTLTDATPIPGDGRLFLWRGDITTLAVDAIVNAANSGMLGCWAPGHYCIDNAIHTFAGVQLRLECAQIMEAQGHAEPTAQAKVTRAWNLLARRVIHTVGPIAQGHPTARHELQLAECYRSCLDAAAGEGLHTIAFCCISTGVFGFPARRAAQIAVDAVRRWLGAHPDSGMQVVFNVFLESDEVIYRDLLGP